MKERTYFYDLHCHTIASPDTPGKLKDIACMAKKRGVDGIAVADHDKIYEGPLSVDGIDIIPATEISLKGGDHLLGYFVSSKVKAGLTLKETISLIHKQGGYAVWAHPLRRKNNFTEEEKEALSLLDGLEAGNAMDGGKSRKATKEEARRCSLIETAGSDAHICGQVGTGVLEVSEKINKENFLDVAGKGKVIIRGEISGYRKHNMWWKRKIRKLREILRLDGSKRMKNLFARVVIRNYLRLNNIRLKRIDFNLKDRE